jgi:hypothetical protein
MIGTATTIRVARRAIRVREFGRLHRLCCHDAHRANAGAAYIPARNREATESSPRVAVGTRHRQTIDPHHEAPGESPGDC